MRKLQSKDIFQALRVIRQANIKEELRPLIMAASSEDTDFADIGFTGILTIIDALTTEKSENAFYEFLAGPFEMLPQDISEMEISELEKNCKQLAKENDLHHFFSVLQGLIMN